MFPSMGKFMMGAEGCNHPSPSPPQSVQHMHSKLFELAALPAWLWPQLLCWRDSRTPRVNATTTLCFTCHRIWRQMREHGGKWQPCSPPGFWSHANYTVWIKSSLCMYHTAAEVCHHALLDLPLLPKFSYPHVSYPVLADMRYEYILVLRTHDLLN